MTTLPTTDLYFLNACGGGVSRVFRRGPVRRLGDNCFAAGEEVLLIRRDDEHLMNRLAREHRGRLVYLVDDDIEAAAEDGTLPQAYRERLIRFHATHHAALVARADTLVVTSAPLMQRFAAHRDVRLLHPVWHLAPADERHFEHLARGGPVRAVHLGTASHEAGLDFLKPVVGALLERFPRFHFAYVGREPRLGALDAHPRVARMRPQSWSRYRRSVGRLRAHLGLYPLPPTPFNRARSRNKLLEHAIVGAVGVYPRAWPAVAAMQGGSILAGDRPEDWVAALALHLEDPATLVPLARKARELATTLNDPGPQRRFWADVLGLPPGLSLT